MLRLTSEASNPGDLNRLNRGLSLSGLADPFWGPGTRLPPGQPGPRGLNTPPRFFAAPPPTSRRKVSLRLGAALVAAWLVVLVLIARLHLPPLWAKADIGAAALIWAGHVGRVVLHNRALDRR